MGRPIVFLSDYGLSDGFVGTCHSVIASIDPDARIVDLTHMVRPADVLQGALLLADAMPYAPADAVVLAVVDPGVGTARRALAVASADGRVLVGPDNGLLVAATEACGGAVAAAELGPQPIPWEASSTFHGRDVFGPAAARLAAGAALEEVGDTVDPTSLVGLDLPEPVARDGRLTCVVLDVDRFGNVQLSARPRDLVAAHLEDADPLVVTAGGGTRTAARARTFGELAPEAVGLIVDSRGWLALVVSLRSAAGQLGLRPGDRVVLTAAAAEEQAPQLL